MQRRRRKRSRDKRTGVIARYLPMMTLAIFGLMGLMVQLRSAGALTQAAPRSAELAIDLEGTPVDIWTRGYTVHVAEKGTNRPVEGATVTIHADHAEMPGAHPQTVQLQPGDRPGEYRGQMGPVMIGPWKLRVEVTGPVTGSAELTDTVTQ